MTKIYSNLTFHDDSTDNEAEEAASYITNDSRMTESSEDIASQQSTSDNTSSQESFGKSQEPSFENIQESNFGISHEPVLEHSEDVANSLKNDSYLEFDRPRFSLELENGADFILEKNLNNSEQEVDFESTRVSSDLSRNKKSHFNVLTTEDSLMNKLSEFGELNRKVDFSSPDKKLEKNLAEKGSDISTMNSILASPRGTLPSKKSSRAKLAEMEVIRANRTFKVKFKNLLTKRRFWLVVLSIAFLGLLYLILLVYSISQIGAEMEQASYHSYSGVHHLESPSDEVGKDMRVEVRVMDVDLNKNIIATVVYFFPSLSISNSAGQLKKTLAYNLKYNYGVYNATTVMAPVQANIPILTGSFYYYPFDKFTAELLVEVLDIENSSKPLPIEIDVLVSTPSLWFNISRITSKDNQINFGSKLIGKIHANEKPKDQKNSAYINPLTGIFQYGEDTSFKVRLSVSRPDFAILFSCFVVFLMWSLSLTISILAVSIGLFTRHRPGASYLALGPGLLFALPTMRASQPGVPSIGILIDVIGFFWNMILVTVASNALIMIWMNRLGTKNAL